MHSHCRCRCHCHSYYTQGGAMPVGRLSEPSPPLAGVPSVIWPPVIGGFLPLLAPPSNAVDEEDPWAPVWKPVEQSPQFERGLLQPFLREWELERYDHIHDSAFPTLEVNGNVRTPRDEHNKLKTFLKHVRESRGYDVDVYQIPLSVKKLNPFGPYPVDLATEDDIELVWWTKATNFVLEQINAQAEHCKRYELLKLEKWVEVLSCMCTLITFSVKEVAFAPNANIIKTVQAMIYTMDCHDIDLIEWRFKPQPN